MKENRKERLISAMSPIEWNSNISKIKDWKYNDWKKLELLSPFSGQRIQESRIVNNNSLILNIQRFNNRVEISLITEDKNKKVINGYFKNLNKDEIEEGELVENDGMSDMNYGKYIPKIKKKDDKQFQESKLRLFKEFTLI